ncbi:MAG: hypothetical protein M1818_000262 [Claussenomyces sp. TS43310]|nr:MAG: hypothetical protein M1818_000262 [Claussenomyces sp. TS43310]
MPQPRVGVIAGLAVAGGVGYYLYGAGGSAKAAEKQFEGSQTPHSSKPKGTMLADLSTLTTADVSKASAKLKSEMPGKGKQTEKQTEAWASEAGAKLDSAADKAREELARAEGKFDQYRKDASKETLKSIDKFDAKVEEKAAQAKSGLSSWFGGK